jgi:hypothetical protein
MWIWRQTVKTATILCAIALATTPAIAAEDDAHSLCLPDGPPPEEGYVPYEGGIEWRDVKVIDGVPAYLWEHGCGPTAAGMVVGYWDGHGFPLLIPGDASSQTWRVDQAIATSGGPGTHYSDYSLPLDNPEHDPYPLRDRSEWPPGDEHDSDSLADFMRTSWSVDGMYYGWSFGNLVDNALSDYVVWSNAEHGADYAAMSWNETWGEFSWNDFVAEIDADRPIVLLVDSNGDGWTDHFVTAIGYRDTQGYPEYACLDTWSTGIRWERFRQMSDKYDWGIHGATYFVPAHRCPPDVNGDGVVDVTDLLALLGNWGGTGDGDINDDGVVDVEDLLMLLAAWGECP